MEMYILQTHFAGWSDAKESENLSELVEVMQKRIDMGYSVNKMRIVQKVEIKFNTTVEVVK